MYASFSTSVARALHGRRQGHWLSVRAEVRPGAHDRNRPFVRVLERELPVPPDKPPRYYCLCSCSHFAVHYSQERSHWGCERDIASVCMHNRRLASSPRPLATTEACSDK